MSIRKPWLFLSTALLGVSLAACGGDNGERPDGFDSQADESRESSPDATVDDASDGDATEMDDEGSEVVYPGAPPEPQLSDGAARVFVLGQISGHLAVARELHQAGDMANSDRHFAHPVGEVMAGNPGVFTDAAQADLTAAVEAVATAAMDGDGDTGFDAAYDAAQTQIAAAMEGESLADHAAGLSALMDQTRDEYVEGVVGSDIVNVIEYQDAWGFTAALRATFEDRRAEYEAVGETEVRELDLAILALQDMRRSVNSELPPPVSAMRAAVTRVQTALLPFQTA